MTMSWQAIAAAAAVLVAAASTPAMSDETDLVITEVMQNPAAVLDSNGEWFEVFNAGPTPVDMLGFYFYDFAFDYFEVAQSVIVQPGEHVVFGRNGDSGSNGGVDVDYMWENFALANDDDEITMEYGMAIIDEIVYDGGPMWPDPNGASMFYNWGGPNDDPAYWEEETEYTYGLGDYGTPGYDPRYSTSVASPSWEKSSWTTIKRLYLVR